MLVKNHWLLFLTGVFFTVSLSLGSFHSINMKYSIVVAIFRLINELFNRVVVQLANLKNCTKLVNLFYILKVFKFKSWFDMHFSLKKLLSLHDKVLIVTDYSCMIRLNHLSQFMLIVNLRL
jgi:hypothetical protein